MSIITPERAGEIRGELVEKHGATWLHHYHEAIEAEVVRALVGDDCHTDDFGKPLVFSSNQIDEVAHALTGDEGEEDSLTVLWSLAGYVSNVWPGKTALQVLIETEEAQAAVVGTVVQHLPSDDTEGGEL